jgi:small subunit ribosomal protein S16
MAVKIRLQRHGRKKAAYFHIVAADSRSKRDGKYIDRLGSYNPNTHPATIEVHTEKALKWLQVGAQVSDTCKALFSVKGVMYKNHLQKGVTKGAFNQEEADKRFANWVADKQTKLESAKDSLLTAKETAQKERLTQEAKVQEAKRSKIQAKRAEKLAATIEAIQEEKPEVEAEAAAPADQEPQA